MHYNILIVGQGLAGTLLSYQLFKNNINFLVIDNGEFSASKVAAGMFTPVGGKRFLPTNKINELLPYAISIYKDIEKILNIKFLYEQDIVNYFSSKDLYEIAFKRFYQDELKAYLQKNSYNFDDYFYNNYNSLIIKRGGWVNTEILLEKWKEFLKRNNSYIQEDLKYSDLSIGKNKIYYKNLSFNKLVFCEGYKAINNPFFKNLPFQLSKGEMLKIKSNLPKNIIIKKQIYLVNFESNIYKIGSTYEWNDLNNTPSIRGLRKIKNELSKILKKEYTILEHLSGIRATTRNRELIIKKSDKYESIFIFNGLGTKGVINAPYYSRLTYEFVNC
jgi:glycine/D-amino acid oxidase-like deaminating enzyme